MLPELVAVDETAGDFAALERVGRRWEQKFAAIERDEPRAERCGDDGLVDLLIVAYGSLARIAEYALPQFARTRAACRASCGRSRCGRSLPRPSDPAADDAATVVVAELSMGQMIDDVDRAIGRRPDGFVNWLGGRAPSTDEFAAARHRAIQRLEPDRAMKGAVR